MHVEDDILAFCPGFSNDFSSWGIHRVVKAMDPIEKVVGLNVNEHAVNGQIGIDYLTAGPTGITSRDDIHRAPLHSDSGCQSFEDAHPVEDAANGGGRDE